MKILFKNANILNTNKESGFFYGCVVVEGDEITYVGESEPVGNFEKVIDVCNNILMPGFVNAHCHSPMTLLRGLKDDVDLQSWLFDHIMLCEKKLTKEDIYWGQMLAILEYVKAGITTIEECYFEIEAMVKAIEKSGIRARVGIGGDTRNKQSTDVKWLKKQYNQIPKSQLISPALYLHSVYTLKEDDIEKAVTFASKYNLPHSMHLSETLKEVGDCSVKNNMTPPQYLESLGFFDKKCLCYHCVHMDKDDLQILADYDVSVATCPSSNIKLASGIAPVYAMQNKKINIAIGTDGAASNNSLDMFKEMFLVATLSKVDICNSGVVSAKEVLDMATKNGAKALGFNTGEIQKGKKADIILINLNSPHFYPQQNLISHLVYSAKSSDVYFTMVGGKVLYENDNYYVGEEPLTIYKNANLIRKRIM